MQEEMTKNYKEMKFMFEHLKGEGVKLGDRLILNPFLGRRRNLELKRTKVHFTTDNVSASERGSINYHLGRLGKEKLHYILERRPIRSQSNEPDDRYFFYTNCPIPFRVNGVYAHESYVEKGDKIELGYNVIEFQRSNFSKANTLNLTPAQIKVAQSELPLMLEGETGTGKTSLAKKIHARSMEGKPFVHINLSSFSEKLIESELFGHMKGSFTGAIAEKIGAFEQANGGTLFIDEIDSLPIELQAKLLIFLDEKKIRKVGGVKDLKVNCRLIFASGKNLRQLVANSQMRRDFYYRIISGAIIKLPTLRDNVQKIQSFCEEFEVENKVHMNQDLIDFYKSLPWPGNYRQLKSHLNKKRVIATGSKLLFDEMDEKLVQESSDLFDVNEYYQKDMSLDELKYHYVHNLLVKYKNNKSAVAKVLGITPRSVNTISRKVQD
tara:strand:+ start:38912 stop:40222 length:1311 start_codon:yes stop_codon:yes gene_type:complete